ncbi:nicotinic acid mononucleotide adenyltransferase [Rivularia sp. IAM M-261]|nr:nicotinic acid mononucleotide adenyltransferase [Calothrix sp. PCC 7716]GJD15930.1 nicotinic acid mononucleotide adenyltransferase [Rivularia sp. IAM M-261]
MQIALFGTSADPPTAGHQKVLKWLSECFDLVAVWAAENPFKSHKVSLEHRVIMLQMLIDGIESHPSNVHLQQDLSSLRTLETLDKAKQKWHSAEYTLVVGSDLLTQLPRWYRIEDLLQQVKLLVIPRPGYAINETSMLRVKQLSVQGGAKITIAPITGLDVSSTSYREHGNSDALTPSVIDYINQQHLYKCQDVTQNCLNAR